LVHNLKKENPMKKLLAIFIAISILTTGCASSGYTTKINGVDTSKKSSCSSGLGCIAAIIAGGALIYVITKGGSKKLPKKNIPGDGN
jgi:hypothetical protein